MITNIDDNMGIVSKKLKEWGMEDNTLVIFMTDNGSVKSRYYNAGMTGGKNTPNEGGCRVPSIWKLPTKIKAGIDIDTLTRHFDILPTFADLAGADISALKLDGTSLIPLIENPSAKWAERTMFFHKGRWGDEGAKQEKHLANPSPEEGKHLKYAVRTERWRMVGVTQTKVALYDIQADPGETKDVIKANPEVAAALQVKFENWWDEVRPLMINDDITPGKELYYKAAYREQLKETGIPDWVAPTL